jgi:hypothetical protein
LKNKLHWYFYETGMEKFPYKIYLEESLGIFLDYRVQGKWPGTGKKIFYISEGTTSKEDLSNEKPVDKCPIILAKKYGKKLNIILDRKTRKRFCYLFYKRNIKRSQENIMSKYSG